MKKKLHFAWILITGLLLFTACKKEIPAPPPPIANAGNSQTVQLPVDEDQVTLTGSGTAAKDHNIVGYLWSLVSGPNVPVITSPSSATTTINGLVAGTYNFQFAVIDDAGLTGVDTMLVIVKPSVIKTVTIQPANNPFEGYVDLYAPNDWFVRNIEIPIIAWTAGGFPETQREGIKFDYSVIPAGAIINNATLFLYAIPTPLGGNTREAHSGSANACYIQRITSSWVSTNNPFSWYNQPTTTTVNQAIIPQSTSAFENNEIDVTNLVKDMLQNGNNGFYIRLQNETIYNARQYASSYHSDATIRPKLVITYQ